VITVSITAAHWSVLLTGSQAQQQTKSPHWFRTLLPPGNPLRPPLLPPLSLPAIEECGSQRRQVRWRRYRCGSPTNVFKAKLDALGDVFAAIENGGTDQTTTRIFQCKNLASSHVASINLTNHASDLAIHSNMACRSDVYTLSESEPTPDGSWPSCSSWKERSDSHTRTASRFNIFI
jgi:hypothetical protein